MRCRRVSRYDAAMATSQQRIPVAVVGAGRMGQHHARTYAAMEDAEFVGIVDADAARAQALAEKYNTTAFTHLDALLAAQPGLKAASVAVPTVHHAAAAEPLLNRGIACLVEKPLASSVAEAKKLADTATRSKTLLQVGHTERFNPAVRAVAAMKIPPRFIEVDRVSPMTFRSLDVGVVMDMMIHDLDIVLMLVGEPIESVEAVGMAVLGEHEDVCNARLTFRSGCVAILTASRVALKTDRRLRLFSEQAYVSLDYQKRSGVALLRSANDDMLEDLRQRVRSGADLSDVNYQDLIALEKLTMDLPKGQEDPLTAQLTSFLDAVRAGHAPAVSAEDGYEAVLAAERVRDAVRLHRWHGHSAEEVLDPKLPPLASAGG